MTLSVCLLLDEPADTAVRRLWQRLEAAGVPTLATHTHGRHLPHLTLAALREHDLAAVHAALSALPPAAATELRLEGFGTFRRSRCWLAPAASEDLVRRQRTVVDTVTGTGAVLHQHYLPGAWVPHLTLAPRLHLRDLPTVAGLVHDVLPLLATVSRAALVDTRTGERHPLPHPV